MNTFPDIAEWYTQERIANEEIEWEKHATYKDYVSKILEVSNRYHLHSVIEVGCGTGWVPYGIGHSIKYVAGIDKNPHMLDYCRKKNPQTLFIQSDIRNLRNIKLPEADLVCSFSVIKHFSLDEWADRLKDVLRLARFGLFTLSVFMDDRESRDIPGDGFHGIWISYPEAVQVINECGHEVLEFDEKFRFDKGVNAPGDCPFVTRKKNIK